LLDSHHGCAQVFLRAGIGLRAVFFWPITCSLSETDIYPWATQEPHNFCVWCNFQPAAATLISCSCRLKVACKKKVALQLSGALDKPHPYVCSHLRKVLRQRTTNVCGVGGTSSPRRIDLIMLPHNDRR
jgi:hypothetical protein